MKISNVRRLAVLLLAAPSLLFAIQDGGLPESILKELKAATVYIKVVEGKDSWSGTGFLFRKDGPIGYVATNAHVADAEPGKRRITAIFHSGSTGEIQLDAEVMAIDSDQDLAVLRVRAPDLPKPIDTRSRQKVKETQVVYTVGFPLGGDLAVGAKNPEATFGKASVSSLRNDDSGALLVIQLDGELNPGNSGGPAVDTSGDLVGVVFAKIWGTRLGFAIPAARLDDLVMGRAVGVSAELAEVTRAGAKVRVRTELCDPFKKIKSVSVIWAPFDPARPIRWVPEPYERNMKEQPLRIDASMAWGDLSIPAQGREHLAVVVQIRVVRGDGLTVVGMPEIGYVDFLDSVTPLEEIRMWQDARPLLKVVESRDGTARCAMELALLIPAKVKSAAMIVKRPVGDPRIPRVGPTGIWGRLGGNVQVQAMTVSEGRAVGEFEVKSDPKGGPVTLIVQGQVELEDRRKVYTSPVVQVVPFARPGIVRAPSKDDWIAAAVGRDRDAGKRPAVAPVAADVALAGEAKKVLDVTVKKIALAGKDFVLRALWSPDGGHVYLLEKSGKIRMVAVPEFRQVRSLSVGGECSHLALSKEGLVVHSPFLGELWILDENTLEFRRKVSAAGILHFTASPGSSIGYASANEKLLVVDLKSGRVVKQILAEDFSKKNFERVKKAPNTPPLWSWGWLELTQDGETLIMVESRVHRFRVSGADVTWEEIGPGLRGMKEVTMSPDGKYFSVLEQVPGSMENKSRAAVYSVKELAGPLVTLPTGFITPRLAFAFDKEAGKLYCAEYGRQVVVYSPKGERAKQYEIEPNSSCDFMVAHPSGNRVLLATNTAFYWVDLRN